MEKEGTWGALNIFIFLIFILHKTLQSLWLLNCFSWGNHDLDINILPLKKWINKRLEIKIQIRWFRGIGPGLRNLVPLRHPLLLSKKIFIQTTLNSSVSQLTYQEPTHWGLQPSRTQEANGQEVWWSGERLWETKTVIISSHHRSVNFSHPSPVLQLGCLGS